MSASKYIPGFVCACVYFMTDGRLEGRTVQACLAGFWACNAACCCEATFAYLGAEIPADETERQSESVPKAVRYVSSRVTFYYVVIFFGLGLNVSSNDPLLAMSIYVADGTALGPLVSMIQRAGISGFPHVVGNAVALISVLSV
jgi:amino acid permease